MIPVQMIRVGLGDEAFNVPLYRLPYAAGQDGFARPGGFFTTKTGELGIVVDARLSFDEVQKLTAEEIERNADVIAAAIAARKAEQPSSSSPAS